MNGTDEYGRRTLDFVTAVATASTQADIWRLARAELAWYGLEFVTIWYVPGVGQSLSDTVGFNSRPEDYVRNYNDRQHVIRDPVVTAMRRTRMVLSWSEVRQRTQLDPSERLILDEAVDFGATDGLTIPVLTSSGCLGVVSPCGRQPDLSARARSAIEMVCLYAHQALQRAAARKAKAHDDYQPLTNREREIMRWVAVGKTNDEIGGILGIQGSTVKTLLARAQTKLNAFNRTYAVVQAMRMGELDMNF